MADTTPNPDVEYIIITFWDKVAILCGAVGLFLFLLLCMLCILCPECFCPCSTADDDDERKIKRGTSKTASQTSTSSKGSKGSYGSTESDYVYGTPDVTDSGPIKWTPLDVIKEQATDWSSDASSGQDVILLDKSKKRIGLLPNGTQNGDLLSRGQPPSIEAGKIDFVLSYILSEEKLVIKVIEVRDIQLSDSQTLVSPYIKVRIYRSPKQFFTFREVSKGDNVISNLEKEMKTRMKRPDEILAYKETFEVNVDVESLKYMTVSLLLCDMDKFSRHVTLGEASVVLKKANLQNVQEKSFSKDFTEPIKESLGKITLGASYLPTSEKLYLTVESIKELKVMDKNTGSTDACVKIYLMYEGKQLKRVKTTVRASDINPVFNESFSFDVPQTEIENVYFSVIVCHFNADQKGTKVIGRIYIGANFGPDAHDLWNSMIQNPRKKIVKSFNIGN